MELVEAKEVVIRDVFVLRVWRTGFGGLNGARRAIGLEDSNKDHRMGPKNPKTGQSVPTAQVSVAPVRIEIPSLVYAQCSVTDDHHNNIQGPGAASVADRIKALLGNTLGRLWEKLGCFSSNCSRLMNPWFLSSHLNILHGSSPAICQRQLVLC